jgi:hypothetical protein
MKKNQPGKGDKPLTVPQSKKLKLDWDQRPEFICPDCGYHKNVCVCKMQKRYARRK